ncbi:MAG TPA: zf-HC2 domain-containing protein [Armatimonadota bacterium]|nr:zf-HC2 domain-containing protein [Armatimonadota bacterium]
MAPHLEEETLRRYRERQLPGPELLEADEHLAACDACRERLLAPERLAAGVSALRADLQPAEAFHPEFDQLAGFVDDTLDAVDREIMAAHLEDCEACAAEIRELRAFKALMSTHPPQRHAPAVRPGALQRVRDFLARPAVWLPLQVAGVGAAAALAIFFMSVQPLRQRVGALRRENAALAQQASGSQRQFQGELERLRQAEALGQAERVRLAEENRKLQTRLKQVGTNAPGQNSPGTPNGGTRLATNPPAVQEGLPHAVSGLVGQQGRLMGSSGDGLPFALRGPVGTVVRTPRPTLRWEPLAGASRYRVTLARQGSDEVLESPELTTTEWTVEKDLKPGAAYTWQVTAFQGDKEVVSPVPPAPEARFRVLDTAAARSLQRETAQAHLTLGMAYAKAGLLEDAERELQLALEADPGSEAARKQLAAVRRWRGGKPRGSR